MERSEEYTKLFILDNFMIISQIPFQIIGISHSPAAPVHTCFDFHLSSTTDFTWNHLRVSTRWWIFYHETTHLQIQLKMLMGLHVLQLFDKSAYWLTVYCYFPGTSPVILFIVWDAAHLK
jgi:hypothetical protein